VNLVLFEASELHYPLARSDRRVRHILDVLRRPVGAPFDAGVINGPRGQATLLALGPEAVTFAFTPLVPALPRSPITLIIGLPRPQTARDILRDATTLGADAIHFVRLEKSERSYAQSSLWHSGEWRRHLIAGAEQAFATGLPEVTHDQSLTTVLATLAMGGRRLALDNYEATESLGAPRAAATQVVLAIGGERGWSTNERGQFRAHGFQLVHLGTRVLRTETAVTAGLAIIQTQLGLM
jgi:RsmE family RNA methyltransferase